MSAQASAAWCSRSPQRAMFPDMRASVNICDSTCVCACADMGSRGWGRNTVGGVEQVPHYQFPAMSLKRAVKSLQQIPYIHLCQSTRHTLGFYTGGNTIYLMLHYPHVLSPPPHAGDSQCLTSISYSEQAGRQSSVGTPSWCKSELYYLIKCNPNTLALSIPNWFLKLLHMQIEKWQKSVLSYIPVRCRFLFL